MNTVKLQHYVPQCYLRNFANAKDQVWVYDKSKDSIFKSNTQGIAGEKYFYDSQYAEQEFGDSQFVEKALSILESQFSAISIDLLSKLAENKFVRIHPEQRKLLALFIAVQLMRTREHRNLIHQMYEQFAPILRLCVSEDAKKNACNSSPPEKLSEKELTEWQSSFLTNPVTLIKHTEIL